jgi:hypothetical protein
MNEFTTDPMNNLADSSLAEFIVKCQENMLSNGLPCDEELMLDDVLHRYSADDDQLKKDEWYIGGVETLSTGETVLACTYGSWSTGQKFTYRNSDVGSITHEEIEDLKGRRELVKISKEAELKRSQDKAAKSLLLEYQGTKDGSPKMNMILGCSMVNTWDMLVKR